jgi:hypothetical protein
MSVLQQILAHVQQPAASALLPALGAGLQQQLGARSMSLYSNPEWKYHNQYGINWERGGSCGAVWG